MKNQQNCPVCFTELEVRECAPCHACGWDVPAERNDLQENKHTYAVFELYQGITLTLCDFCMLDVASYRPGYFGFTEQKHFPYKNFTFIRQLENPQMERDLFCPNCRQRLAFLVFVQAVRAINAKGK